MASDAEIKLALCEVGRRVWHKNFVASNDGNFSCRVAENRIICTPTMMSKGFMRPEDMVVVDLQGNVVEGSRLTTSEIKLHLFIYQQRPEIRSVVHVHPPHATAFAIVRKDLPQCVLPEVEVNLGEIPIAPYETTGTWEFARSIAPWVATHDAILLTNHGAVTVGQDPYDAYYKMETLDQYCRILILARQIGEWNQIDVRGMNQLMQLKARYGIADPRAGGELCGTAPQAGQPNAPAPAAMFFPDPAPLEDSPKLPPRREHYEPTQVPNDPLVLRHIVEEVLKRMTEGKR